MPFSSPLTKERALTCFLHTYHRRPTALLSRPHTTTSHGPFKPFHSCFRGPLHTEKPYSVGHTPNPLRLVEEALPPAPHTRTYSGNTQNKAHLPVDRTSVALAKSSQRPITHIKTPTILCWQTHPTEPPNYLAHDSTHWPILCPRKN